MNLQESGIEKENEKLMKRYINKILEINYKLLKTDTDNTFLN